MNYLEPQCNQGYSIIVAEVFVREKYNKKAYETIDMFTK
ncbi:hypothetical protein CMALT430_40108 [Carnobacterium maltaromaticum]|nr:hypothetical protein CMALT430_40108 [Carnobacterium maltaromaticum]